MTQLEARGLFAGYGERAVLRDCDLSIAAGNLVAVVGPNGAGKSTLLRSLAGLLAPRRGSVSLDGVDLTTLSRREIAHRIAVVPQVFDTLFPLSVREIVALGRTARLGLFGRASAVDHAAVERAVVDLELDGLVHRRIDTLSGGERQRAVLAMALAQESDVLLLDEPTTHLDPAHQLATLAFVRRLASERKLVVCAVLHDLNLAAAFASRIVVLVDGRVVADGAPALVVRQEVVGSVFGGGLDVITHDGRPAVLPHAVAPGRSG